VGNFVPAGEAQRLLFMMSLSVVLLGLFTSAYVIVEEKSLFLRERMVNLRIAPYLGSKVVVDGGLALVSSIAFMIALSFGVRLPDQGLLLPGPIEIFITLLLTSLTGISIGLLLSAVSREVNAVTYAVLAVLFVQILFPGVLFKMDGPILDPLSRLTVTRWSLEALGGTADMVTRNAEGRVVVEAPVINPKTGRPIAGQTAIQFFPAPSQLSVTYPSSGGDLLLHWAILLGFSQAQNSESFTVQFPIRSPQVRENAFLRIFSRFYVGIVVSRRVQQGQQQRKRFLRYAVGGVSFYVFDLNP
jgi:hypothetical protein